MIDPPLTISPPAEIGIREAARILGIDPKTVRKYIADGAIPHRNIAPPSSSRPVYRVRLADVMAMRTTYRISSPETPTAHKSRRATTVTQVFKHITMRRSA